jgi:hypothetical protein
LTNNIPRAALTGLALSVMLCGCTIDPLTGMPRAESQNRPALVTTTAPAPEVVYRAGSRDTVLADSKPAAQADLSPITSANGHVETLVTRKVNTLNHELSEVQGTVNGYRDRLQALQSRSDGLASDYYSLIASIDTELQSGTTPGNPLLTARWNDAQAKLDLLEKGQTDLNALAADAAAEASRAAWLQESVRAAYGLSGAVDEDHKQLQVLEDGVNQTIVTLNRLLTSVNDEINRRAAYARSERLNLQTLSLGIANGELYGQNVSNTLFRKAAEDGQFLRGGSGMAQPASRRPLVVIRVDRPGVEYQQAVYTAVSQALEKFPAAKFDLVAVSRGQGNPAQLALASTEARKNGEAVLRSLTQMGVPLERVRLNAASAKDVTNSEVHLYIQ